jgi:hypothetical protein
MRFAVVEKNIETLIGLPIETIRKFSPDEFRLYLEKKNNRKFSFTTEFPVIGRGNVLRDNIITSEEINKDIDKILARSK